MCVGATEIGTDAIEIEKRQPETGERPTELGTDIIEIEKRQPETGGDRQR